MNKPVQVWWLGVLLFAPSIIGWFVALAIALYGGMFNCPFDWNGITRVYLPMLAALAGFLFPLLAMRLLKNDSWRHTVWAFAAYLLLMCFWGVIDIKHCNYQMGGHRYPDGVTGDGPVEAWHVYFTWYFMPYEWIELNCNLAVRSTRFAA